MDRRPDSSYAARIYTTLERDHGLCIGINRSRHPYRRPARANQYQRAVVFRLGKLQALRGPGLYWLIPVLEWQRTVDLRTITSSVDQQETITKDNVPVKVTVVIWYAITDPIKS